jgi:uncharacterized protein (TIGR02594 family)
MNQVLSDVQVVLLAILAIVQSLGFFVLGWRALGIFGARPPTPVPAPAPQPAPHPIPVPLSPAIIPPPAPAPKPAGAFAGAPPWFVAAMHEIGFHEVGNNGGLDRYIAMAHCGANGEPWCAIFANAMLESSGVTGSHSASSQSFRTDPHFVQLSGPALGAIAVFWRGSGPSSGIGHVGFYRGEDAASIWVLGGNESDMVQIEALPKSSSSFGLTGYWWPRDVPLPAIGPVLMPSGTPRSIQAPLPAVGIVAASQPGPVARQIGITATMFGGQQSAYGGPIIDSKPGVALPFHFPGTRDGVRVTNQRNGLSVVCDVVDVGPWNTNDPYWLKGARPEAESGTDSRGRHTNKAGIDLTAAAAQAIQLDGKGIVDWEFVESPLASTPKVT